MQVGLRIFKLQTHSNIKCAKISPSFIFNLNLVLNVCLLQFSAMIHLNIEKHLYAKQNYEFSQSKTFCRLEFIYNQRAPPNKSKKYLYKSSSPPYFSCTFLSLFLLISRFLSLYSHFVTYDYSSSLRFCFSSLGTVHLTLIFNVPIFFIYSLFSKCYFVVQKRLVFKINFNINSFILCFRDFSFVLKV